MGVAARRAPRLPPPPAPRRVAVIPEHDPYPEWARRVAASDAAALAALFDATHDALLDYVTSLLRDEAAARDVVQETFVRLWRHRATLDPARPLRAFLYRTARNLAFNAARDAGTRARLLDEAALDGGDGVWPSAPLPPDRSLESREFAEQVRAAIDALPPRQREALVLSRFDGLSHEEVAEVMGCAPRTVNNHLVRALATLRVRLAPAAPALPPPPPLRPVPASGVPERGEPPAPPPPTWHATAAPPTPPTPPALSPAALPALP